MASDLQKILPRNVFLDGDWCWEMHPFVVTDETKAMVNSNITHLLNGVVRALAESLAVTGAGSGLAEVTVPALVLHRRSGFALFSRAGLMAGA